jgi:uncharacterized protein YicC (UPF0701 family)
VPLKKAGKTNLEKLIRKHILSNSGRGKVQWNVNIGNAADCSGVVGR